MDAPFVDVPMSDAIAILATMSVARTADSANPAVMKTARNTENTRRVDQGLMARQASRLTVSKEGLPPERDGRKEWRRISPEKQIFDQSSDHEHQHDDANDAQQAHAPRAFRCPSFRSSWLHSLDSVAPLKRYRGYHRNIRGPRTEPANVHSRIVPLYQMATNGSESAVQCRA